MWTPRTPAVRAAAASASWQRGRVRADSARPAAPPGQQLSRSWPVMHYGPRSRFRPRRWDLQVFGADRRGEPVAPLDATSELLARCQVDVVADFHCVTKFTCSDVRWGGVAGRATCSTLAPPAPRVTHALVWAEYGYSANLPLSDFAGIARPCSRPTATGEPLTPEHGCPLRLVVPHLYAWKGPKWVRGVEYLTSRPARLLGGARLPQRRRPLAGAALLLPGGRGRRRLTSRTHHFVAVRRSRGGSCSLGALVPPAGSSL